MPRLRQQFPNAYRNSSPIHTEFENVIRYLNSAELGDKTIGELLRSIFDEQGKWRGPVEVRLDTTAGLQYRVGTYVSPEDGWLAVAPLADLRGPAGSNVGNVEGPLFYNKRTYEITGSPTNTIAYLAGDAGTETIAVYKNGLLLAEETDQATAAEYTYAPATGVITLASNAAVSDVITVYMIRDQAVSDYRRADIEIMGATSVVAFTHTADERLLVFRNGILQNIDGSGDLVNDPVTNTLTFSTPLSTGEVVTVVTVENQALQIVGGLMLEDEYTDGNGKIKYASLAVTDDEIPQAKVNGLATGLATKAKLTVSSSTPLTPTTGDLWLDTSTVPNVLKFYDGTQWLNTSPQSAIPNFLASNANQYLRVNGTGTGLEFGLIDFSSLVPKTFMGAANGVATLDTEGKMPSTQLPEIFATRTISFFSPWVDAATIANATYFVGLVWKTKIRLDGITHKLASGSCTIQLSVDGVTVGVSYSVTTTRASVDLPSTIEIDGTASARRVELVVTNNSAGTNLEVGIAAATLSV